MTARRSIGLGRRAKYLLADLSSGDVLMMHLGMSGSFRVGEAMRRSPASIHHARSKSAAHDHVVFHMSNGATVTFNDPRRFGSMKLVKRAKIERRAAAAQARAGAARQRVRCRDAGGGLRGQEDVAQSRVARSARGGRARQYLCLRGAVPRPALAEAASSTIADRNGKPNERAVALVDAIKAVLKDAIEAGGSSLRDHRRTDGALGDFQHNFRVYDREGEPCPKPGCKGKIKRIVQTGRSTFYCPTCQSN